jgi:hypothetical protein
VLAGNNPAARSIQGISEVAEDAPGRPLHVFLSMGPPQPYGFGPSTASLAGRFGLVQTSLPYPFFCPFTYAIYPSTSFAGSA